MRQSRVTYAGEAILSKAGLQLRARLSQRAVSRQSPDMWQWHDTRNMAVNGLYLSLGCALLFLSSSFSSLSFFLSFFSSYHLLPRSLYVPFGCYYCCHYYCCYYYCYCYCWWGERNRVLSCTSLCLDMPRSDNHNLFVQISHLSSLCSFSLICSSLLSSSSGPTRNKQWHTPAPDPFLSCL